MAEGLVEAEGFAVDASLIAADANKQRWVPSKDWNPVDLKEDAVRAARDYLATLDDAAFGAASSVTPKFVSRSDPAAHLTGAHKGHAFFACLGLDRRVKIAHIMHANVSILNLQQDLQVSPFSRPLALASKRLLELHLRNSSIVWTTVGDPVLAPVTEDDRELLLDAVVEISLEASPNHAQRRWLRPIFSKWIALNPDVFKLVRIGAGPGRDSVAGFTCVIPLSDAAMELYRLGRLSEWDFDKHIVDNQSAILQTRREPFRNLCIQAITLRKAFWWQYSAQLFPVKALLTALVEHLAAFNALPFQVKPCLIADGNVRGTHILRNHGFQPLVMADDSADGRPIFQLDFAALQSSLSLESRMTIGALETWMTLTGCVNIASRFFLERHHVVLLALLVIDRENLATDLAANRPPTWNILAFVRGANKLDKHELAEVLHAGVHLTVINADVMLASSWKALRETGRDFVPLICRDREFGYLVSRELFDATEGSEPMIELATAVSAAAMLNNSVTAIDKVYNWWRAKQGEKPATVALRNDPQKQVLQYVSPLDASQQPLVVMTYAELAKSITPEDVTYVKSFETRMTLAMSQWEALNAELPLASPVERARIEANMERIKDKDICFSLQQIVDFIEKLGIDLHDHYRNIRCIC